MEFFGNNFLIFPRKIIHRKFSTFIDFNFFVSRNKTFITFL